MYDPNSSSSFNSTSTGNPPIIAPSFALYRKRLDRMQQLLGDIPEQLVLIDSEEVRDLLQPMLLGIEKVVIELSGQTGKSYNQGILRAIEAKWKASEKGFLKVQDKLVVLLDNVCESDQTIVNDILAQLRECYQSSLEPTLLEAKITRLTSAFQACLSRIKERVKQEDSVRCFLCYAEHSLPQRIKQLSQDLKEVGITVLDLWQAKDIDILKYIENVSSERSDYVLVIGTPALKQAWQEKGILSQVLSQIGSRKLGLNEGIIKILYAGSKEASFPDFLKGQATWDFHHGLKYYSKFLELLDERLLAHLPEASLAQLIAIKAEFTPYETSLLEAESISEINRLELNWQQPIASPMKEEKKTIINPAPSQNPPRKVIEDLPNPTMGSAFSVPDKKQEAKNEALRESAARNSISGMKKALAEGADIDAIRPLYSDFYDGYNGCTALMIAAKEGCFGAVKSLVEELGAEIDIRSKRTGLNIGYNSAGNTAVMMAVRNEHTQIVDYLVEKGADLSIKNDEGNTALALAKDQTMVTILKKQKSVIYKESRDMSKTKEGMEALKEKAQPSTPSTDTASDASKGVTDEELAKRFASLKYDSPVVALLNLCKDLQRDTQAILSEIMAQAQQLKATLSKDKFAEAMMQLLFTAARSGRLALVKTLIETRVADKHAVDEVGNTLLHIAAERGDEELYSYCKTLKKNAVNQLNQTILHVAVAHNQFRFIAKCLAAKLNVTASATFEIESKETTLVMPPLHYAVYRGYDKVVEALLTSSEVTEAHLKETIAHKGNLLHLAIFGGQVGMLQALLQMSPLHPLLNVRNTLNLSPLGLAAALGQVDMIDLLVKAGAELKPLDRSVIPPLHAAVCACNLSVFLQVIRYLQHFPVAMKWHLDCEFPSHLMASLVNSQFNLSLNTKNSNEKYTPRRWAEQVVKKLDTVELAEEEQESIRRQQMNELDDMAGFLENIYEFVTDASFTDKGEAYEQLTKEIDELEEKTAKTRFQNLVLKGGGPKGIAYVGAIQALEKTWGVGLPNLHRIAGTSAGAITALGLALDLHSDEILQLLNSKDLTNFIEGSFDPKKIKSAAKQLSVGNIIKMAMDIIKRSYKEHHHNELAPKAAFHALKDVYYLTGLSKGDDFRNWIEALIKTQTGKAYLTLGELHALAKASAIAPQKDAQGKLRYYKELFVVATQLIPQAQIKIFSSEDTQDSLMPSLIISDLIRASMSIPVIFEPHPLYYKTQQGERLLVPTDKSLYVDGGLLLNFPIQLFDNVQYHPFGFGNKDTRSFQIPNRQTVGLSLFTPEEALEAPKEEIENKKELLKLLGSVYNEAESIYAKLQRPIDQERIIQISNLGVSLFEFDIPHRGEETNNEEKKGKKKAEKRITQEDLIEEGKRSVEKAPWFAETVSSATKEQQERKESKQEERKTPLFYSEAAFFKSKPSDNPNANLNSSKETIPDEMETEPEKKSVYEMKD